MNVSGISPFEYKVVLKVKEQEEKTEGGILLPDSIKEKEKYAISYGTLVAIGEIAFTDPDWLDKPKLGDFLMFDKYAGTLVKGNDGQDYRVMNDKEIVAKIDKE